jgi:hypothetical protein
VIAATVAASFETVAASSAVVVDLVEEVLAAFSKAFLWPLLTVGGEEVSPSFSMARMNSRTLSMNQKDFCRLYSSCMDIVSPKGPQHEPLIAEVTNDRRSRDSSLRALAASRVSSSMWSWTICFWMVSLDCLKRKHSSLCFACVAYVGRHRRVRLHQGEKCSSPVHLQ